jgi:spore germination protein YaaH
MFRKAGIFSLVIAIILSIVAAYFTWKSTLPLVSPIALIETMIGSSQAIKSKKIIYGFFPYWNTKHADQLYIQQLTHFAYFAVDLNPDGTINKQNFSNEQEPGWNKLNSKPVEKLLYQSKLLGQKTVLTVTAMDPDLIESIATDNSHIQTAINSMMTVYRDFGFEDINIDFEYVGEPTKATIDGFTEFIKKLRIACKSTNQNCSIDIDIFADSASKTRLWDLKSLSTVVDHFIVMAYDYYRKSSSQAGPVAPLTGKCDFSSDTDNTRCLEMDIISHLSQMTKIIPSEKIILGIPFYGYEWQTASKDFLANTYPRTGALATYQRIQSLYSNKNISALTNNWSETTLSPYLSYE